jgi:hypothetical protein
VRATIKIKHIIFRNFYTARSSDINYNSSPATI